MTESINPKPTDRDAATTPQPGDKGHASQSTRDIKGPSARPNPDQEDEKTDQPSGGQDAEREAER